MGSHRVREDTKKLEYGPGRISAGFPSSLGFGIGAVWLLLLYLDVQITQNHGTHPKTVGLWAILLGILEVQVDPNGPSLGPNSP